MPEHLSALTNCIFQGTLSFNKQLNVAFELLAALDLNLTDPKLFLASSLFRPPQSARAGLAIPLDCSPHSLSTSVRRGFSELSQLTEDE